jgi:acetyl-CoA carboxylase, biotin carboxylase subunit
MTERPPFKRVLVANRGEIAVRIIRACHEMDMEAVAVYSDVDEKAAHVRAADVAVSIGPAPPRESYLRIDRIIEAARTTKAEAVHPGYGFLAEQADFARACDDAGLVFVGPSPETIAALGNKLEARRTAAAAGVATVPGTLETLPVDRPDRVESIRRDARAIGFPVMVKAAAGGGGRGMRRVERDMDLPAALAAASAEAASAFADGSIYLERIVAPARHIEVQLLGDDQGRVIAIGERDCSIQRRHQKLVEEAPAPGLTTPQRRGLHDSAIALGRTAGLRNAATAEFLYDPAGNFWFLEVNTRLQVEHGVTELVSGVDIVREQLCLAAGWPLSAAAIRASERATEPEGHAIEVRVSAEDPSRDFAPTPGRISRWSMPGGPGVRVDTAIDVGAAVPPEYDNLMAKILVHAADRPTAIGRLRRALDEVEIGGPQTTLPFDRFVARDPAFAAGALSTGYVADRWDGPAARRKAVRTAQIAAGLIMLKADLRSGVQGRDGSRVATQAAKRSSWRMAGWQPATEGRARR